MSDTEQTDDCECNKLMLRPSRALTRTRSQRISNKCKVSLQQWNFDYDSMLQLLNFPPLSTRRNFLKLTTMYKIIGNFSYFPPGVFVQHNFPYSTNQHTNFSRPFARTQYMFSSFVPRVITLWNALPNSVKHASSISVFKRLLHSM